VTGPERDDELARLLGRLRSVEPAGGSPTESLAGVRRRVARHEARVRGTAIAVAVAAAVALVVIPSVSIGSPHRTGVLTNGVPSVTPASSSPAPAPSNRSASPTPATPVPGTGPGGRPRHSPGPAQVVVAAATAYDSLGCPSAWDANAKGPWVPAAGSATSLIAAEPVRFLVCSYPASPTEPRGLSGEVSVHQGFASMSTTLADAGRGRLRKCAARSGVTNFLVRADYPDGTTSWVSVTSCIGATNGAFSSSVDLAPELADTLAEQGSWGAPYPGDCATTTARPGIDTALVPGGSEDPPLLGYLCVTSPGPDQQPETALTGAPLDDLVTKLGGLSASSTTASCPDSGGTTYVLVLVYAGGENVSVSVNPGCDTGVTNGVLVAAPTDELVNTLDDLSTSSG